VDGLPSRRELAHGALGSGPVTDARATVGGGPFTLGLVGG